MSTQEMLCHWFLETFTPDFTGRVEPLIINNITEWWHVWINPTPQSGLQYPFYPAFQLTALPQRVTLELPRYKNHICNFMWEQPDLLEAILQQVRVIPNTVF